MASRKYDTFKFEYYADDGNILTKRQRAYKRNDGTYLTPITPTFQSAILQGDDWKVEGSSADLRHALAYVTNAEETKGWSESKANLPYAPRDARLVQHIREIIAVDGVLCADYVGERTVETLDGNNG